MEVRIAMNSEIKFCGSKSMEKELGIKVPIHAKPYAEAVYGNQKEIDRLLSFKVGNVSREHIMDLIENIVRYAILTGMKYQRDLDYHELTNMQRELDVLIKKDGNAAKERKKRANANKNN